MELLLVRHAEPVRIEGGHGKGPADPVLTERGRDQAARLAAWLAHDPIDAVVTSPLVRARETAQPVAAAFGLEPEVVEGIAEWDADSDEYIPVEELRELKDERWYAMIEGRWTDTGGVDPSVFQAQIVPAVDELIARFAGRRVVAVTHGGVVNVYLAHVLGIARHLWFHPEYTSVSRVHASRDGMRSVGTVNETAHLVGTRSDTSAEAVP
jgi:2,3-bisphosphoglycerate-dependent phosphoglycerate mutase